MHTKGAESPTEHKPFSTTKTKGPTLDSMLSAATLAKLVGFPGRESHPMHCRHHKCECSTELRASRGNFSFRLFPILSIRFGEFVQTCAPCRAFALPSFHTHPSAVSTCEGQEWVQRFCSFPGSKNFTEDTHFNKLISKSLELVNFA